MARPVRDLRELDKWRQPDADQVVVITTGDDDDPSRRGAFLFQHKGTPILVVATTGVGWDHVSVSTPTRCPTWDEMEWIAKKFFRDDEVAMQLHVPASEHISNHRYCLHWWSPQGVEIPLPPSILVGVKAWGELR